LHHEPNARLLREETSGGKFFRVNRSSLIGLQHVKEIVIWFGNRFKIILSNGKEVISSREKSKSLKQVLKF
ncbi:MAG: LytTR family DNA-binding domain-containing protein, partial [Pseudomonadota bacterium]